MQESDKSAGAPGASRCSVVEQADEDRVSTLVGAFVDVLGEIASLMRAQRVVLDAAIQSNRLELVEAARAQADQCGFLADHVIGTLGRCQVNGDVTHWLDAGPAFAAADRLAGLTKAVRP